MPRLIFKRGKVEYHIPHGILKKLVELGKESRITGLEKGTELCSISKKRHPTEITGTGRECTGDSCSIKIEDCGDAPSTGDFHTHPCAEDYVRKPQRASFGDLLYLLWKSKYTASPGLGCRIGVAPRGLSSIQCDKVKRIPNDKEMQSLEMKFDKYSNFLGEEVINKNEYFYPTQEIQIDGKIEDKYVYKLNINSRLFSKYPIKYPGEIRWMNTRYFLQKLADKDVIESIEDNNYYLIEDIEDKIKKGMELDPMVMVIDKITFSTYLAKYAPIEIKNKIKDITAAIRRVEEEFGEHPSPEVIERELPSQADITEMVQSLDPTIIDITEDRIYKVVDYEFGGILAALAARKLKITRIPVIKVYKWQTV